MPAASSRPQPRPGVLDIEAYVPGKSTAEGVEKIYKLSSNETPLGPSPKAIEAFKAAVQGLEFYPDGLSTKLPAGPSAAGVAMPQDLSDCSGQGRACSMRKVASSSGSVSLPTTRRPASM